MTLTIRDIIERDLGDEPQSVVRVYETETLRQDIREYVLTDRLAREFAKVLEGVVDAARPASSGTSDVGIWISGFFGSGKSHFAKLAGHLLADTPIGDVTTRALFAQLLHDGRSGDERVRELLQQASTYRLSCMLVPFDVQTLYSPEDQHVSVTFLRAFYRALNLSNVMPFAERELELQAAGLYAQFLTLYEETSGVSWDEDKDLTASSSIFAECLAQLQPNRYPSAEAAERSLSFALEEVRSLTADAVTERLLRWLARESEQRGADQRLIFVVDEVGAWTARDINRIEQLRGFTEKLGEAGRGRAWLAVTSQERLADVVQNAPAYGERSDQDLLQRLEARYRINVHLESSEVGTVIEDRILKKTPQSLPALQQLWSAQRGQLMDMAEQPGLELLGNYPSADQDEFVRDYPFLPYQMPLAAEIFGGMRSVRISSGARSMIKVVFDATRDLADRPLGTLVGWDRIFDSANKDNEFSDDEYLGSHGMAHLLSADQHVGGTPVKPSRLLKVLWLVQQSNRVPKTARNLARLLANDLDTDILRLERDVEETLNALAEQSYVRLDAANSQWRYLSEDEVTVEKIVQRIAHDIGFVERRRIETELYARELQQAIGANVNLGRSATSLPYALYLHGQVLRNADEAVALRVAWAGSEQAGRNEEENKYALDQPVVYWVVEPPPKVGDLLVRALAIERLHADEEFQRVATERTRLEADKLALEAGGLRREAGSEAARAFQGGQLLWAGQREALSALPPSAVRGAIEDALRDRMQLIYTRHSDGDLSFAARNIERLMLASPGDRAKLDPAVGLFSPDGHLHGNQPLVEELSRYLKSATRNSGAEIADYFFAPPFGWQRDLVRYVLAAMFIDAKLTIYDKSGKRYDNPHDSQAHRLLTRTTDFNSSRFDIEEESLTPQEAGQARTLLTDLGQRVDDATEIGLRDATITLANSLLKRAELIGRAAQVDLPLPSVFEELTLALDELDASGSRVKTVRALLVNGERLRAGHAALTRLETFDRHNGFEQYVRSQRLLEAALQAGLADDPDWGDQLTKASDELAALKAQRRVLDEWNGAYRTYRADVIDIFRECYAPLRRELHNRVTAARTQLMAMDEYQALGLGDTITVRARILGDGRPLGEVPLPEHLGEDDLLSANAQYNMAHMRSALAALDSQLSDARRLIFELYEQHQQERRIVVWDPRQVFAAASFASETEIDETFDTEKERLKAALREGKQIRIA